MTTKPFKADDLVKLQRSTYYGKRGDIFRVLYTNDMPEYKKMDFSGPELGIMITKNMDNNPSPLHYLDWQWEHLTNIRHA